MHPSEHSSTAHGIRRTGLCRVSGKHLSEAPNEPGVGIDSPLYRELANLAEARAERNVALVKDYVRRLHAMDWSHEFSDDHSVYCSGRDELRALHAMQREIDRDLSIWNSIAPAGHRVQLGGA